MDPEKLCKLAKLAENDNRNKAIEYYLQIIDNFPGTQYELSAKSQIALMENAGFPTEKAIASIRAAENDASKNDANKKALAEKAVASRAAAAIKKAAEEFAKTPLGQARVARAAGLRIFQLSLPLSQTKGYTIPMAGAYANTITTEHGSTLDSIEDEGWRLEHAGYVYKITGSVSRDKLLSSGQQEAVHGEIVGVYIFRAVAEPGEQRGP